MKKLFLFVFISFISLANQLSENLKEYVGVYKMESVFNKCTILEQNGNLYAEVDQNGSNKLLPTDKKDVFKSTSAYGTIFTFYRNEKNEVISVNLFVMDNNVTGKKEN